MLTSFQPDRDYRNLEFASVTRLATDFGNGSLNLAYMDHPFGADQFYGNFNSWEDTKTWFAGVQQALGAKTSASFSFRRHSDLFVLYRDRPDVFANHHSDETYQLSVRRREEMSTSTTLYYGVEGLHESIESNNLGDHARSRAAAYAAAILGIGASSLPSARDDDRTITALRPHSGGGSVALPAMEGPRIRQPRLPYSQLHRPVLP